MFCFYYGELIDDWNTIKKVINKLDHKKNNERIVDLEINDEYVSWEYHRTLHSVELIYDKELEVVTPEMFEKVCVANCILTKSNRKVVIYGHKNGCSYLEKYLKSKVKLNLSVIKFELTTLIKDLIRLNPQLRKVEFNNANLFGTKLKSLRLEFFDNKDAYDTLSKIKHKPSKAQIEVILNDYSCYLDIDFLSNKIKLEYKKINKIHYELIRDILLKI